MDESSLVEVQERLGYTFNDPQLLRDALVHASVADHRLESNERLEFLGDAILGAIVCEHLYHTFDSLLEGDLTKIKSSAVSWRTCARVARSLGIDQFLILGKGMNHHTGVPSSMAAAVFESVIAAIFLDGGYEPTRTFILHSLEDLIRKTAESGHQQNFKSILQQHAQQYYGCTASYMLLDENGPDHAKCFEVAVEVGQRRFESCWAPSKKEAEQKAALNALVTLEVARVDEETGEVVLVENGDDE